MNATGPEIEMSLVEKIYWTTLIIGYAVLGVLIYTGPFLHLY